MWHDFLVGYWLPYFACQFITFVNQRWDDDDDAAAAAALGENKKQQQTLSCVAVKGKEIAICHQRYAGPRPKQKKAGGGPSIDLRGHTRATHRRRRNFFGPPSLHPLDHMLIEKTFVFVLFLKLTRTRSWDVVTVL